jgi:hypothetical protein
MYYKFMHNEYSGSKLPSDLSNGAALKRIALMAAKRIRSFGGGETAPLLACRLTATDN